MADNFNHLDERAGYEIVNHSLHKPEGSYYSRSKFMNDFPELGIQGRKYFIDENNKLLS